VESSTKNGIDSRPQGDQDKLVTKEGFKKQQRGAEEHLIASILAHTEQVLQIIETV